MYIYLLSFVFAKYERKVQSLIFKDNDHTICIHINVVFQICHPEKQNPDSIDALVQNILENFLSELSFESFASLTKTSISLLSIRILYQDSSCFFFLFTRVGYKCLSEVMKMAKIDFQIMKFVTIEDI